MNRGDEDPININGIISRFEQRGRTPNYVFYYAELVPKMWRTELTYQSVIYQNINIEKLVTQVLDNAGFSGQDYEYNKLKGSYPDLEYIVQYQETDFNFINRRLEHYGIFYYFDHRDDNDVIVFSDTNETLPAIEQSEDIYYNPNRDPLFGKETMSELRCKTEVVTGQVKLKDYNYQTPTKNLYVESQIDKDAPGTYYEYGNHFKDSTEGKHIAQIRNEEILSRSEIYSGKSDCRLFRAGFKFKMGKHYIDKWNEPEYLLTKVISQGTQRDLFNILPDPKKFVPTYMNDFEAIPIDTQFRSPRRSPVPRLPGIMTSKLESGTGDEYAFLDDKGRYKMKVPFDLSDIGDGKASCPIRLSQPYSGPGYGVHFPNHADTEIVWSCIDGDIDRPLGLGTVPNPSNSSPSTSSNKWQSVIRTAGANELTFDDKTGKENIYLHGTKDWTIEIANNKDQTIGNDESLAVGNNRSKKVGANQSESIGANKTISVGGNHSESISGNMSQTVSSAKTETISLAKALTIGAAYQVTVGAAMNETVGGAKMEEVGAYKSVSVGGNMNEKIGGSTDISTGKDFSIAVGQNFGLGVKGKGSASFKGDLDIGTEEKLTIKAKESLLIQSDKDITLKAGKAKLVLKKDGKIELHGGKLSLKGTSDIKIKGSKVAIN
jgi:type VI secretion system secreted protein VgrG